MAAGGNWLPFCRLSVLGEGCLLLPRPRCGQEGLSRELPPLGPGADSLSLTHKGQSLQQLPTVAGPGPQPIPCGFFAITSADSVVIQPRSPPCLSGLAFSFLALELTPSLPTICSSFLSISSLIAHSLAKMLSLFPSASFDPAHSRSSSSLISFKNLLGSTFVLPNS